MAHEAEVPTGLVLPTLVFGVAAVHQLQRELEKLEEFMRQQEVRQPGTQGLLPKMSRTLDALAAENHCNLLKQEDRDKLIAFIKHVAAHAPTLNVSFASDPSAVFTVRLVEWLRTNIDPLVLVQVGLQPSIAAGCIVRARNKVFDFSLRHRLDEQKNVLLKALDAQEMQPATVVAPETLPVNAEVPAT